MGVFYPKMEQEPSRGICYGCRHPELGKAGHCNGTGHLEGDKGGWPGFVCTCECVPKAAPQ